jgi:hypothetical protein
MPKCERWVVAQKMVPVFNTETMKKILKLGGQVGVGWNRIHQHVCVSPDNKEAIEAILIADGFEVTATSDIRHPEIS